MRSIKPGRASSWGGVIGGVMTAVFGIFWIGMASSMGAPSFFVGFGVVFVLCSLVGAIYSFYNATARNRFSHWDITDTLEEPDPLAPSTDRDSMRRQTHAQDGYCPFCGAGVQADFEFCPKCGKRVKSVALS